MRDIFVFIGGVLILLHVLINLVKSITCSNDFKKFISIFLLFGHFTYL